MKVRINPFIEFAYGDKRKDKSKIKEIFQQDKEEYDPAKDRYKQFREALVSYETAATSEAVFKDTYARVSPTKSAAYKIMSRNYLDLKEDHALIWDGSQRPIADLSGLKVQTSWYLHTSSANLSRIICLNFRKDPYPRKQERGILTLLQIAEPNSAGVGILNIQASTMIVQARLDLVEKEYLEIRAKRFLEIANSL